jgi:hypothetical protein
MKANRVYSATRKLAHVDGCDSLGLWPRHSDFAKSQGIDAPFLTVRNLIFYVYSRLEPDKSLSTFFCCLPLSS